MWVNDLARGKNVTAKMFSFFKCGKKSQNNSDSLYMMMQKAMWITWRLLKSANLELYYITSQYGFDIKTV